jgi:syntaxin-binding protein 1
MIRAVDAPYKVLVVDKHTLKIIHAACNLNELLDENITLVESLERKRQPYPSQDAIYFISPTPESVDIVIQDFTVSRYNTSGQLYSNIHLFFTSALDDRLFFKLKQSTAIKYIKTCKEFYLDFIANESQCFSMERNMALVAFFGTQVSADYLRNEYSILSRQLTSFLISIGEFPIIRYSRMNSSERVTGRLASLLYEDLQKYSSGEGSNFQQGKSILLILDRTTDLVAPILHEFTYQAMAFDLLPSVDGRIKVGEKKEIILDESTDSLWTELRHCHIADAITAILSGFNKFITENRAASGLGKKADVTSLAQLRDMLSSVPQFQEQKGKYTNHINLVQECMGLFGKSKLSELGTIEQNLSTGETAEGTDVKHVEIDMVPLLDDPSIR